MKRHFLYIMLCLACCACTNTGTMNILIANRSAADRRNVQVAVACSEIKKYLEFGPGDSLQLLNEANRNVPYRYSAGGDSIVFSVNVVKAMSQKNYSLNVGEKRLADNLLRFRTASVMVDVSARH